MSTEIKSPLNWYSGGDDRDVEETEEWLSAFEQVVDIEGGERGQYLLRKLLEKGYEKDVTLPFTANTPYINTIPLEQQPPFPGNRELERRIKSLVRWNAMAMVVRANKRSAGPRRPHLHLRLVGHPLRGRLQPLLPRPRRRTARRHGLLPGPRLAGHLRPRLPRRPAQPTEQLDNFRRELAPGGGLSSYPHPWLMPDFWQFPTVSMGLAPIMAIYQARFNRYLRDRGLKDTAEPARLVLPRRRRDRRAGVPRRHHPRLPREARQPDLRHQLQPAAARRPGARQRQDHPGAGGRLPRRRLERHQGHLGRATGTRCSRPTRPACSSSA